MADQDLAEAQERHLACALAFRCPDGRSIPTEAIEEGVVFRLHDLLRAVINDLPSNRDWLDPAIEAEARALLSTLKVEQK